METLKLTKKQAAALNIMRNLDRPVFPDEIAAEEPATFEKGGKSVSPLMNGFFTKELVTKADVVREVTDKNGNKISKPYKQYTLTEAGKSVEFEIKD